MTEFLPAAEIPQTDIEDLSAHKRIVAKIGGFVMDKAVRPTREVIVQNKETIAIAGSLAIAGVVSTAAQLEHWFDHSGVALEFFEGSGRHLLVGYVGAKMAIAKSRVETMRGKLVAGITGAMGGDIAAEVGQSLVMTGIVHHGSAHDIMSFLSHKEIFWGNAKDALAAELAAVPAMTVE